METSTVSERARRAAQSVYGKAKWCPVSPLRNPSEKDLDNLAIEIEREFPAYDRMVTALERVWDSRFESDKWSDEVSKALEAATGKPHPFASARELLKRIEGQ